MQEKEVEIIKAKMTALATGGSAVGEVEEPANRKGMKAFIPYVIPGETITAEVIRTKKSFFEASLKVVEKASPARVEAPCPYFGSCGGCDLQHIALDSQREMKRKMIEDTLRIQGGITARDGVRLLGPDLPFWNYRRRMSFHLNRDRKFGLFKKNGRQIVEIDQCLISTNVINKALLDLRPLLVDLAPEAETITLEDRDGTLFVVLELHPRSIAALDTLTAKSSFVELRRLVPTLRVQYRHRAVYPRTDDADTASQIPVGHFSQNNEAANDVMIRRVVEWAEGDTVTELFAGAGNLTIPLALAGKTVTAVEVNEHLVRYGEILARNNGVSDRVTFILKSCEKWVETAEASGTIVLDPPRGGALEVAERLNPREAPLIVYVSCFPPTFIRDVKVLSERGYELIQVDVLDMFPQTYHAELIGLLRPRS